MSWVKRGLVYTVTGEVPWARSHAQVPTVDVLDDERWRIYFSTRDEQNRSRTTFVDVKARDPSRVLYERAEPILELGRPGAFDDSGVMPAWIVSRGDTKFLYYSGWTLREPVPYEIQVGLAVSTDGGDTWERYSDRPVLGRVPTEPLLTSTPCVVVEGDLWRAWYLSGTKWEVLAGRVEAFYHLKYAESSDGIDWVRDGTVAIDYASESEGGIVRPSVIREGLYKMWFCARGASEFRADPASSYRIGYAESDDGVRWSRKDHESGIDVSASGWDSQMIAYPFVFEHGGERHMLYNGNGFGASGFGWATWEE